VCTSVSHLSYTYQMSMKKKCCVEGKKNNIPLDLCETNGLHP